MKRIVSVIAVFAMMMLFCGCVQDEKEHIPNTFPLSEEMINRVFADNDMPMVVKNFTEIPTSEEYGEYYNHNYVIYDAGEVSYGQGSLQFLFGDIGNRVTFSYIFAIPGTTPSWKYHEKEGATEQAISVACDLYGNFADRDGLVKKITKAISDDDLRYYSNQVVWYEKYEGVHILVQFATKGEGSWDDKLYFRSIQIADDACFKTTMESSIEAGEKSSNPDSYDWARDIYDQVYG